MRKIIGKKHPDICCGGSMSEGQWRSEFAAAGWPIREPDQRDVEVGIQRVYSLIREDRFYVMENCEKLIDEFGRYSRPVDEYGNPMEGIEDKETMHGMDSIRYIASYINRTSEGFFFKII